MKKKIKNCVVEIEYSQCNTQYNEIDEKDK